MRRIGMAVLGLALMNTPLVAQRSALREVGRGDRGSFGVTLAFAEALGSFQNHADFAAGLGAYGVSGHTLGLRIEGSWIQYARGYYGYDVSTASQIATLAAGPQLTLGGGALRMYGFATVGGSLFWSSASYGCGCGQNGFLDGDFTTTTSGGGGLQIAVAQRRTPIFIDLSVRGVHHDRVQYIPANGLSQNPDGSFSGQRVEAPVDLRVYQIGVSIGIR
jgi:hypothetical protein